ncbi:hypothetical protein B0H13DRAFT_1894708 [Mycena leptocephala]|nr:hypothetical protein B0H13DRAFT_1894708 [Mycena leptocephala]
MCFLREVLHHGDIGELDLVEVNVIMLAVGLKRDTGLGAGKVHERANLAGDLRESLEVEFHTGVDVEIGAVTLGVRLRLPFAGSPVLGGILREKPCWFRVKLPYPQIEWWSALWPEIDLEEHCRRKRYYWGRNVALTGRRCKPRRACMMRDGKRHQIGQAQANNPTARTGGKLQSIQKPYERILKYAREAPSVEPEVLLQQKSIHTQWGGIDRDLREDILSLNYFHR